MQGRLDFAIVDEVDSILIDEARTPLIISGPAHDDVARRVDKWPTSSCAAGRWDRKSGTVASSTATTRHPKLAMPWHPGAEQSRAEEAPADRTPKMSTDDERASDCHARSDFLTDDQVEAFRATKRRLKCHRRAVSPLLHRADGTQAGRHHPRRRRPSPRSCSASAASTAAANMEWPHLIENSLRAHMVYERDKDYVVQDGADHHRRSSSPAA